MDEVVYRFNTELSDRQTIELFVRQEGKRLKWVKTYSTALHDGWTFKFVGDSTIYQLKRVHIPKQNSFYEISILPAKTHKKVKNT
jgi:hypothetical protein